MAATPIKELASVELIRDIKSLVYMMDSTAFMVYANGIPTDRNKLDNAFDLLTIQINERLDELETRL